MRIIITESQKKMILLEGIGQDLGSVIKQNVEVVKTLISKAQKQLGTSLQFLLTWGAGISGFMPLINDYIQGRFPELTEEQIFLISVSIISTHFFENKEINKQMLDKIKETGILKAFKITSKKILELKSVFYDFVDSLGVTFHRITNMLSYAFMIPIIPMLAQFVTDGLISNSDLKNLGPIIVASTGLAISGIIVNQLITKMVRRFKSK
jgi:hypothetical protein